MTIGQRLKRERLKRGWTQHELSRIAKVRQALISELEAGKKRDTTGDVLKRFARVFGVSMDYLAGLYDEDPGAAAAAEGAA